MSGDIKHEKNIGPNDPELRDRPAGAQFDLTPAQAAERRHRVAVGGPTSLPAGTPPRADPSEIFTKAVAQVLKEQMQPGPVEAPSVLRGMSGPRMLLMQVVRLTIAVAIAASIALLLVMAIPALQRPAGQSTDTSSFASIWQSLKSSVLPAAQPKRVATLSVQEGRGLANEPLPLGIHAGDPPADASVTISGLPANARLTSGRRVSAGEWRVPASEVSVVSVIPPDGFVGQMQLTAELRDGGGAALAGSSSRLSWAAPARAPAAPLAAPAAPAVAAAPTVAAPAPAAPQNEFVRNLDPREVAALVRRGQDLLASGDVQSARLLLLRAAEARDARAALLYGKTYDPALLKQIGASGPLADVAQARLWYQKAMEWGEPEAQRQLDALASPR
jgi:hypothetical protein